MYKKNTSGIVYFYAVDSADGVTGKAGLTLTVTISKDGGAFAPATNSATSLGNGFYYLTLTSTELNADTVMVYATGPSAIIAPVEIRTEGDYTSARASKLDYLDLAVSAVNTSVTTVNTALTAFKNLMLALVG